MLRKQDLSDPSKNGDRAGNQQANDPTPAAALLEVAHVQLVAGDNVDLFDCAQPVLEIFEAAVKVVDTCDQCVDLPLEACERSGDRDQQRMIVRGGCHYVLSTKPLIVTASAAAHVNGTVETTLARGEALLRMVTTAEPAAMMNVTGYQVPAWLA